MKRLKRWVTPDRLFKLGLIDEIIPEPLGGAHRDLEATATTLKTVLTRQLKQLQSMSIDKLVERSVISV